MGVSINGVPHSWMIYFMENPMKIMNDLEVHLFQETHIYIYIYMSSHQGHFKCIRINFYGPHRIFFTRKSVKGTGTPTRKIGIQSYTYIHMIYIINNDEIPCIACIAIKCCFFLSGFNNYCLHSTHMICLERSTRPGYGGNPPGSSAVDRSDRVRTKKSIIYLIPNLSTFWHTHIQIYQIIEYVPRTGLQYEGLEGILKEEENTSVHLQFHCIKPMTCGVVRFGNETHAVHPEKL